MNPSIIEFPITMKQKLTHTLQNGGGGHVDVGGTNQGNKETRENIKKKK